MENDKKQQPKNNKHDTNLYSFTALAYAQEIIRRWSTAKNQCDMDLFLMYIKHWMPNNIVRPLIVRIFR